MRESDIRDLREKIREVDTLKLEVERLGGEVEILRGVVEEGLKERRKVKEAIESGDDSVASASRLPVIDGVIDQQADASAGLNDLTYEQSRVEIPSPPPSRPQTPQCIAKPEAPRFIDEDELDRLSADLEERRSERSLGNARDQSVDHIRMNFRPAKPKGFAGVEPSKQGSGKERTANRARFVSHPSPKRTRVYAKTPARSSAGQKVEGETPFPQIRGSKLEQLFFSAPEHNAKTCRVCHRRSRPGEMEDELDFPSWLPPRKRTKLSADDGQCHYKENKDQADVTFKAPFAEDRLPPQTVLVRVLRELEDDFTHYKG